MENEGNVMASTCANKEPLTEENVGDTLNESDNIKETNPTISARIRIPTDKGKDFKVQLLKQSGTAALSAISRKRTEIIQMMSDQNNYDLVRNELTTFDTLCQRYQEEHNNLYQALETAEEKDQSSLTFSLNDSESFEFRKQQRTTPNNDFVAKTIGHRCYSPATGSAEV